MIDLNDYRFIKKKYGTPKNVISAPISKGRIHPHVTRFIFGEKNIDVFHVKPVYYLHLSGEWRSLSEVCTYLGNHTIVLKENWDKHIDLRFLSWLIKRMNLIKGNIYIPSPFKALTLLPEKDKAQILFATDTFYPDPNPETTSVDGNANRDIGNPGASFATIRAGAATAVSDTSATNNIVMLQTSNADDANYINWSRSIYLFDTSTISDTASITAASLSLYGSAKANPQSWTDNSFGPCVVSATTASNTSLATGDFDIGDFGATEMTASRIGYTSFSTTGYNDMTLNSTGLSHISKTTVTKFGVIAGWDFDNTDPGDGTGGTNASHSLDGYYADQADTTNDPKLVVTSVDFIPKVMIF